MSHFLSDPEKKAQEQEYEHSLGVHSYKVHQDLSKPISKEFPSLSDRDVLMAIAVYELHWTHERVAKVFGLKRQSVTFQLSRIKHKLAKNREKV